MNENKLSIEELQLLEMMMDVVDQIVADNDIYVPHNKMVHIYEQFDTEIEGHRVDRLLYQRVSNQIRIKLRCLEGESTTPLVPRWRRLWWELKAMFPDRD